MQQFGKVAVLYGGLSAEREVSLNSGRQVLAGLQQRGVDAHGVDVGHDIVQVLQTGCFDRAFNILHGRGGEDGSIQAVLEFLEIPYCGSGVAASALAMDKMRAKWIWQANHIATPDFMVIRDEADLKTIAQTWQLPIAVKPVHEGSSCGVSKVTTHEQLPAAYINAKRYNDEVIAERWIEGGEYTVSIVDEKILPSIKITTPRAFYDYEAKYIIHTTVYDCPSGLNVAKEAEIKEVAWRAYQALGCKGWGRVDLMQDKQGKFWVLEINTLPGMTPTSLVPKAARAVGIEFPELVVKILATSL